MITNQNASFAKWLTAAQMDTTLALVKELDAAMQCYRDGYTPDEFVEEIEARQPDHESFSFAEQRKE
jgi:hypothetical protein